jgi:hypothetical protein
MCKFPTKCSEHGKVGTMTTFSLTPIKKLLDRPKDDPLQPVVAQACGWYDFVLVSALIRVALERSTIIYKTQHTRSRREREFCFCRLPAAACHLPAAAGSLVTSCTFNSASEFLLLLKLCLLSMRTLPYHGEADEFCSGRTKSARACCLSSSHPFDRAPKRVG